MKLLDINLTLYAYSPDAPENEKARAWFEGLLSSSEPVLFPLVTILGFIRIGTDPRVYREPLALKTALEITDSWLALPHVRIPELTRQHWKLFRRLCIEGSARGGTITDAHIAALAIEHGATLCTTDRGFARFPGISMHNPLTSPERG